MAGTYEFDKSMCSDQGASALCIDHAVTIEAEVAGSVVLDAKGAGRVIYVSSGGQVELVGLNITGGDTLSEKEAGGVCAVFEPPLCRLNSVRPRVLTEPHMPVCCQGGGLLVWDGGKADLEDCKMYDNLASDVCCAFEHSIPLKTMLSPVLTVDPLRVARSRAWALSRCGMFLFPRPRPRAHPSPTVLRTWQSTPPKRAKWR